MSKNIGQFVKELKPISTSDATNNQMIKLMSEYIRITFPSLAIPPNMSNDGRWFRGMAQKLILVNTSGTNPLHHYIRVTVVYPLRKRKGKRLRKGKPSSKR